MRMGGSAWRTSERTSRNPGSPKWRFVPGTTPEPWVRRQMAITSPREPRTAARSSSIATSTRSTLALNPSACDRTRRPADPRMCPSLDQHMEALRVAEAREAALRAARMRRIGERKGNGRSAIEKLERDSYQSRYKAAARRWTSLMVALPILIVTSYHLYDRREFSGRCSWIAAISRESSPLSDRHGVLPVLLGHAPKSLPRPRPTDGSQA